jgi:hypothetical protein
LGFNVSCITNKKTVYSANSKRYKRPSHKFEHLFFERQCKSELDQYDWGNSTGLGTFCGQKFNKNGRDYSLIVLDFDNEELYKCNKILKILGLPSNYEWVVASGSKLGFHIYVLLESYNSIFLLAEKNDLKALLYDSIPYATATGEKIAEFKSVEILIESHIVLPPSIHASTFEYEFIHCDLPLGLPEVLNENRFGFFIDEYLLGNPRQVLSGVYISEPFREQVSKDNFNLVLSKTNKIILDIETDGLIEHDNFPNILQIAWYCLDNQDRIIKKEVFSIDNKELKLNKSFNINKLSINILNKIGCELIEALRHLNQYLLITNNIYCYNKEFDLNILNYYLKMNKSYEIIDLNRATCLMNLFLDKLKMKNFIKLEDAYNILYPYNKYDFPCHNAESDVYKTYLLYLGLKQIK